MPTQSDCPRPASVVCATASYVNVPERETMPGVAGSKLEGTRAGAKITYQSGQACECVQVGCPSCIPEG